MLLPTDQLGEEKFAKSAVKIALHNFQLHYATLILFNSTLLSVDLFLRHYQNNVYVGRNTFYPSFVQRIRQYVIFGEDLPDIVKMLTWMQKHQFDNTGMYIVVCQSDQWDTCSEIGLVNILWNFKIINVVLINTRKGKTLEGFTYYYPEDCRNPRPFILENWDSCLLGDNKYCQNLYPLKFKNLHQCPIVVSTFDQVPYMDIKNGTPTGADGDLLNVIANAMNLSLVMMTPHIGYGWGKVEENGSWSGSLADVYNGWANFSMTSASVTLSRFTTFQMSTDYAYATIAWITHPSEVEPASLKLLRPFQPQVQIALGISFLFVVLLYVFFRCNFRLPLKDKLNVTIPYDIIFHSWTLCIGFPVSSFPTNRALLYFAVFWMWYCLLIRTFYQVCLISSLQKDVYYPEFDTIEEAIESGYTFGGGLALRDYYIDYPLVYDGWKDVESVEIDNILVKLSQGLKFVLAMNLETTKMFLSTNPHLKLRILPRVVLSSPIMIFFKKYSPLRNSLNVVLSRLTESGIIQKIYKTNTGKKVLSEVPDNKIPITMVHYTGCYAILLAGWLLASTCFIGEILISLKKKRKYALNVADTKSRYSENR